MTFAQLTVGVIHQMPCLVGCHVDIVGSLGDRMLVEPVEAGRVDDIDDGLGDSAELQGGVDDLYAAVAMGHLEHGAIVNALFGIACGMAEHSELPLAGFDTVGDERCEHQSEIQRLHAVGTEAYGDDLVGVRGEILAVVADAATYKRGTTDSTVETELPMIASDGARRIVVDIECGQRLIILRVVTLYVQLQRVGQTIIFIEQCLADFGNPACGTLVLVTVDGTACPQGDVVQLEHIPVGTSIDERTQFAVANGQRFFKISGRTVVPKRHGWLVLRTTEE